MRYVWNSLSYEAEIFTRRGFREVLSLQHLDLSFNFQSRILDSATTEYAKLAYIANVELEWQLLA